MKKNIITSVRECISIDINLQIYFSYNGHHLSGSTTDIIVTRFSMVQNFASYTKQRGEK